MNFTSNIVALFLLVTLHLATVSGSALPLGHSPRTDTAPLGYDIVVPKWKLSHRGEDFEFEGSNEEAHSYMKARFSDYDPTLTVDSHEARQVKPRAPIGQFCIPVGGQPWQPVLQGGAKTAIANVRVMSGTLFINAGCCTRIYCNGNTNMWVCNENTPNLLVLPADIGVAAQSIVDHCSSNNGSPFDPWNTGGQAFDDDGFNVVISWGQCSDISGGNDKRDEIKQLARRDPGQLTRRDMALPPLCCPIAGQPWTAGFAADIQNAINAMSELGGISWAASGHECISAWCTGMSSVWVCNDNDSGIIIDGTTLALFAQTLLDTCGNKVIGRILWSGGQLFNNDDHFNVIVKRTANGNNCDGDHL